jgi:3-dehydroquinate synthase
MYPNNELPLFVSLDKRSYPIYIKPGLISKIGDILKKELPSANKCAVITSNTVYNLYGKLLWKSLNKASIETIKLVIPEGEEAKTWKQTGKLIAELIYHDLDRNSLIAAFGGGVTGDIAGFVASIYLRGINMIQLPTTLLAQVDSSIGGKTAVNHPKGKNLIGSFHQPCFVASDPALLKTLPKREIRSGLAEIVKYGVIADAKLFNIVEKNTSRLLNVEPEILTTVIQRCATIKAGMIESDERDVKGIRVALNYGHTFGHALEIQSDLKLNHGEAIAIGMNVESRISERLGLIDRKASERQEELLNKIGLNIELPVNDLYGLIKIMHRDKKAIHGDINIVLPTGIGEPTVLKKISESLIIDVLKDLK